MFIDFGKAPFYSGFQIRKLANILSEKHTLQNEAGETPLGVAHYGIEIKLMSIEVKLPPIRGDNRIMVDPIGNIGYRVIPSNNLIGGFNGFGRHFPTK